MEDKMTLHFEKKYNHSHSGTDIRSLLELDKEKTRLYYDGKDPQQGYTWDGIDTVI